METESSQDASEEALVARPIVVAISFGVVLLVILLLVYGRTLLVPFAVAIMIWYVINAMARFYGHLEAFGWRMPRFLAFTLSLGTIAVGVMIVTEILSANVLAAQEAVPKYEQNVDRLIELVTDWLGLDETPEVAQILNEINIRPILSGFASAMTNFASSAALVAIYVLFLLMEQNKISAKIDALFPNPKRQAEVRHMLNEIQEDIQRYIWVKTIMSVLTGVISYAIMVGVGVHYAAFWGFVIFLLNYIPTIGSMMGVAFPALLTLIQFGSFSAFAFVSLTLGLVQFVIGNILEPRMMGRSLNLSPLVIMLSLVLWGTLWGIPGMFLCVPIMVVIMIILSNFPQTRPIAILLSGDGRIR